MRSLRDISPASGSRSVDVHCTIQPVKIDDLLKFRCRDMLCGLGIPSITIRTSSDKHMLVENRRTVKMCVILQG